MLALKKGEFIDEDIEEFLEWIVFQLCYHNHESNISLWQ